MTHSSVALINFFTEQEVVLATDLRAAGSLVTSVPASTLWGSATELVLVIAIRTEHDAAKALRLIRSAIIAESSRRRCMLYVEESFFHLAQVPSYADQMSHMLQLQHEIYQLARGRIGQSVGNFDLVRTWSSYFASHSTARGADHFDQVDPQEMLKPYYGSRQLRPTTQQLEQAVTSWQSKTAMAG